MPDLEAIIDLVTAAPGEGKPVPPATALGLIRAARLNLTVGHDPITVATLLDCPKGQADSILKWGEKLGLVQRGSTLTGTGRARVTYRFTFPDAAADEPVSDRAGRALASLRTDDDAAAS